MTIEHSQHVPVMLEEVLNYLQPGPGGYYIDGTIGGGGHTAAILERTAPDGKVLGIDADTQALARVRSKLGHYVESGRLILIHGNFADMARIVQETGFVPPRGVQGVLLDLGFSSDQVESPQRGFSFSADGPLDMRLDQSLAISAADLIQTASEQELADIFWRYGEEARSRMLARRIVRAREQGELTSTTQLAKLVAAGVPYKPGAIHPATRVFQALRIAVNHELERLQAVLPQIIDILTIEQGTRRSTLSEERGSGSQKSVESEEDGESSERRARMAIIAFHSLEDRVVKEFLRREATDCLCPPRIPVCVCGHKARLRILTSKPVTATAWEVAHNPRSRSAKLRVAEVLAPVATE